MRTRAISGLLYVAILLLLATRGGSAWTALVSLLCLLAVHEALALARACGADAHRPVALAGALAMPVAWQVGGPPALVPALVLVVLAAGIDQIRRRPEARRLVDWLATIALPVAIALPLAHLVGLRQLSWPHPQAAGPAWLLVVLGLVWANDSAAYLAGRAFGRRPFFASISPKKTWEGAVAGMLACGLLGAGLPRLAGAGFSLTAWQGLWIGLVVALAGTTGDLMESVMKRQAGVKDSGTLMPGHGGILDRVDSLIWVAPVAFYLIAWLTGGA
ncbi:MAG: phosphatidate cytidylyltransferase [Ardenticatenia bacterium]|nr:phosphatidate cytidylyltransferase [Ardenticatenia bacterium]